MERKERLHHYLLILAASIALMISCTREHDRTMVTINFRNAVQHVRSEAPDEDLISDISLMIFDEYGNAEECRFLRHGNTSISITLLVGKRYTFCACANFGYQVYADHIDELQEIIFHMAYPDEYKEGMAMAAVKEVKITEGCTVDIALERLMAKISLSMDRSHLNEDVEMYVRSARIGNCPRHVRPFRHSHIENEDEAFPSGFILNDIQTSDLNIGIGQGRSKEVSLYMFENMQGSTDFPISLDKEKVFDKDDPRSRTCSFVELEIEYMSKEKMSKETGLIYRFYLGEDRNSFDVLRNTHYHITVTPENDGISENSWRVDQSGLQDIEPAYFRSYPSDYIRGDIGDIIHIWCEFGPSHAPFDVGIQYMEDDKAEGIYDYVIDPDGHGVVLTLTGPGRGLIYMEAGDPINDAALFIIEVNQP